MEMSVLGCHRCCQFSKRLYQIQFPPAAYEFPKGRAWNDHTMRPTPLCPRWEGPGGLTACPSVGLGCMDEWEPVERRSLMMPHEDTPVPTRVLNPTVLCHWRPDFVPELGEGDLLVSGKSTESSILVITLWVSACLGVKPGMPLS